MTSLERARDSKARGWLIRLAVAVCVLGLSLHSWTAGSRSLAQEPERHLDVVLVIDNSQSMAYNDGAGLRWSAAQLFVDLATPGDRIGALRFSTDVDRLGDAADGRLTPMGDAEAASDLKRDLAAQTPAGGTNMNAALRDAEQLLAETPAGNKQVIVFLTDGKPEPAAQRPDLANAIREAGARGILVFPILLGEDAATDVADQMVHETGALAQQVRDPRELLKAFGSVYAHVQPQRYVNQLEVRPRTTIEFRTNPDQAVTGVSVVIPRRQREDNAVRALTVDGQDAWGRGQLQNGAEVTTAEATHYQMARATHNAPLAGAWQVRLGETEGTGLLIVRSEVVLDLVYPVPSRSGSFVAPRVVPAGKEVLLVGTVERAGSLLADAEVLAASQGRTLRLDSVGLSPNRTLYWGFLDLASREAGNGVIVELQVGEELTPFRLRKQFVVEPAEAPVLVLDSPSATQRGLQKGGRLLIEAHFEQGEVTQESAHAYIWDTSTESDVIQVDLSCSDQRCVDESVMLDPARRYQVLVVGRGTHGARPFTDAALATTSTDDLIRIDGLAAAHDLGQVAPGDDTISIPLEVTAFTEAKQPKLSAHLTDLEPDPAGKTVVADLSALRPVGSNVYEADLLLRHLPSLPSGNYSADVVFDVDEGDVIPAEASISFSVPESLLAVVEVIPPADRRGCPGWRDEPEDAYVVDFGLVLQETARVNLIADATWIEGTPDLRLHVEDLHEVGGGSSAREMVDVRVGTPTRLHQDRYEVPITLEMSQDLSPGRYAGKLALSSPGASVTPTTFEFRFDRPGLLGRGAYKARPALCFLREWLTVLGPELRLKGCFGWLVLIMTVIVGYNVIQGGGENVRVVSESSSSSAALDQGRPVFVVHDRGDPTLPPALSQRQEDSGRALAKLWLSPGGPGGEPSVTVTTGDAANRAGVAVQRLTESGRWQAVGADEVLLQPFESFRVLQAGQTYYFSVEY